MQKAKDLLLLLKTDNSFINNKLSLVKNLEKVRGNSNIIKLTLLVRNSESARDEIINCINNWKLSSDNDLRVFSLLITLVDANRFIDSILLSIDLQSSTILKNTKMLAMNILLKEALDV